MSTDQFPDFDDLPETYPETAVTIAPPPAPSVHTAAWPVAVAGALTFAFAFILFVGRLDGGIAFGPWQGAYLDGAFPYRVSLLSMWVARATSMAPIADPAWMTAFTLMVCGALASAMLAIIAAQTVLLRMTALPAAMTGIAAGIFFTLTPAWGRIAVTASPATLTVLLTLIGLAFLQHAILTCTPRWLRYAGLFLGLACANDPSFAIVFVIALLAALGELGERVVVRRIFSPMLGWFALAACIPLMRAFFAGESLSEFLSHAMATAYPTIGDGAPQFGFGLELRPQFAVPVLVATALGLTALFLRGMRGVAVTWAMLFLAMGPFWPALTNQHVSAYVVRDIGGAASMAYAAVCLTAAWGLAWLANATESVRKRPRVGSALIAGVLLVAAVYQYPRAPHPQNEFAAAIGQDILDDCAPNGVIVSGNPQVTSLLRALQISRATRRDVIVLSVHALEQPQWRQYLHRKYEGKLRIAGDFPPESAWQRWPLERPTEFTMVNVTLRAGRVSDSDFSDLMLWEFMRDNFSQRPVYFAGITSPWLTARAKRVGMLLQFGGNSEGGRALERIVAAAPEEIRVTDDLQLSRTIVSLLLPLTEATRRQDGIADAERLASYARSYGTHDADAWLASARAAARLGARERAIEYAANYIQLAASESDMQLFLDLVEEDLNRHALAERFTLLSAEKDASEDAQRQRAEVARSLWDLEELTVLSAGYEAALRLGAADFDSLYEGAAVQTQLGNLTEARATLGKAAGLDYRELWSRLKVDGRFFLLEADKPAQPGSSRRG